MREIDKGGIEGAGYGVLHVHTHQGQQRLKTLVRESDREECMEGRERGDQKRERGGGDQKRERERERDRGWGQIYTLRGGRFEKGGIQIGMI